MHAVRHPGADADRDVELGRFDTLDLCCLKTVVILVRCSVESLADAGSRALTGGRSTSLALAARLQPADFVRVASWRFGAFRAGGAWSSAPACRISGALVHRLSRRLYLDSCRCRRPCRHRTSGGA